MWKLTDWGQTRMPLTGVPWRDLSDEEFAAAEARYPELRERGYFAQSIAEPAVTASRRKPGAKVDEEVIVADEGPPRNLEVYPEMSEEHGND